MLLENNISQPVQFFHLDALTSTAGRKADFDPQPALMASSLYRRMARQTGAEYERAQPKKIFRNLLHLSGQVDVGINRVVVTLDKRAHDQYLAASGLADRPALMPWLAGKRLVLQFA